VETGLVILQPIYQAGPLLEGNVLRESHEVLSGQSFALLRSLDESLQRVRENWESSQALSTFISVSSRLLPLATEENIKTRCLAYLHNARTVTFGWVDLLTDKAYEASNDSHRAELLSHAVELALICADTFNVDEKYLDHVLGLPNDGSIFIQCCIHIHDSASAISGLSDPIILILHQRWKSLCYRSYPILAKGIL
jgi:hypothetical protein